MEELLGRGSRRLSGGADESAEKVATAEIVGVDNIAEGVVGQAMLANQ